MVAMAQPTFTHGRIGARVCDVLKTDLKNADVTTRNAILQGLYKYAPRLVRWFIICYGGATKLFHSVHGFVGWVRTGVKQGDPMATILFAVAPSSVSTTTSVAPTRTPTRPERGASQTTATCTETGSCC